MQTFADEIKAGTFNSKYSGALLVADVDMTGKEWTSLNGFTSTLEGRGFTIRGLKTPLFGEDVVATISNLNVEGDLVETTDGKVGLIARSLVADGEKVGTIFNCSAKGSIEYKNETLPVSPDPKLINIGGVVGGVYGGMVTLSDSDVNITVTTSAGADGKTTAYTPCVGGVVGYACENGKSLPVVMENTSSGAIVWDDDSKSTTLVPFIGGVAGYVTAGSFADNINSGALQITAEMFDLDWGGVIGASKVDIVHCENKGSLTINEKITKANIGGVIGKLEAGSITDSENSGALLFDEKFYINDNVNIGGVIAYADKGTKEIKNCSNSGSITYLGECKYEKSGFDGKNAHMRLGGVVGFCWSELVENCHNLESGVLLVKGGVSGNGDINAHNNDAPIMTGMAGVVGSRCGLSSANPYVIRNCSNKGSVTFAYRYCGEPYIYNTACIGVFESNIADACNNEGVLKVEVSVVNKNEMETTTSVVEFVSGLFGCIYSKQSEIKNCKNVGDVIFDNAEAGYIYMAGISSMIKYESYSYFENCANEGNIIVGPNVKATEVYLGGMLAHTLSVTIAYSKCYNNGAIKSSAIADNATYLGAIFGLSYNAIKSPNDVNDSYNAGAVVFDGRTANLYMGGYCGCYVENIHSLSFTNRGGADIQFMGDVTASAYIGGVAGLGGQYQGTTLRPITGGEFVGMVNHGKVSVLGYAPTVYAGGAFGAICSQVRGVKGLTNNGIVEYPANDNPKGFPESIYIGGVFGYANTGNAYSATVGQISDTQAIADCTNTGDVIYSGIARDGAYVGGIAGAAVQAPIFNCVNDGDVFSDGHAGDWSPRYSETEEQKAPHKWQNIKRKDLAVGGIVGETDFDMSGCTNNGAVTHECLLNPLRVDYIGETATSRFDVGGIAGRVFVPAANTTYYKQSMSGIINNGKVTILGVPSATLNSPSIDLESNGEYQWTDVDDGDRTDRRLYNRVNVAGLVGRMMDYSKKSGGSGQNKENEFFMTGCTNNGDVTVPEAGGAKCLSVAGAVADLLVSQIEFNQVTNAGKIAVDGAGQGTIIAGKQMMHAFFISLGGIVATHFDMRFFGNLEGDFASYAHNITFNQCVNSGNIHYGETGASVYQTAGGILGRVLHHGNDRCINTGEAGYSGGKWYKSYANVTFNGCKNSGNIDYRSSCMSSLSSHYNYNYAGGILGTGNIGHNGVTQYYGMVFLMFDHCENSGSIQFDRNNGSASDNNNPYNTAVGGIVGHYTGGVGASANSDKVSNGGTNTSREHACNATIKSCKNSGHIHGFSGYLGGIIGNGNWYVKITGTPEDPTINTGDIVVVRENGQVVTRNRYGTKYMYAGGIAGYMREFHDIGYATASAKWDDNNSHPAYMPEHMYCRIEYAVNEGAVGSTGMAGGIAGYYYSAVEASKRDGKLMTHRGGLESCRNTGDIYALEESTINVGAIVGMPRMFTYTGTNTDSDIHNYLMSQDWQIGVRNCEVGGSVLRGAVDHFKVDENNYQGLIYGEPWTKKFYSVIEDKPYDGCTFYVAPTETPEETPEDGEEGAEPAKR
jgi:hypothetical protein